jgi:hypothetical protein
VIRLIDEGVHSEAIRHEPEPERRYSLMRVGAALFAYTDFGRYLRGLGQAWQRGFVPEPLPSALGCELPELAGVDADLAGLVLSDVEPPR